MIIMRLKHQKWGYIPVSSGTHTNKMYELMFGCNRQVAIAVNTSVITMNIDENR